MEYGPGVAAIITLFLSLIAKLYMSFGVNVKKPAEGYESLGEAGEALKKRAENASRAQLNVTEYEGLFIAIFLFWYVRGVESVLVTVVAIGLPIAQAIYFWGRVFSGQASPWSIMGALPRYVFIGMSLYVLFNNVTNDGRDTAYGPGLAAVAVLAIGFSAKLFMSFGIRGQNVDQDSDYYKNASGAQLNIKEYDALFLCILLFFYHQKTESVLVTVISYWAPLAQLVYFWGRVITGSSMPCAPIGALSRYIIMGMLVYILVTLSPPGSDSMHAAIATLALSLAAKMFMTFGIRATNAEGEKKENASRAQLNVAEYDDVFLALYFFMFVQKIQSIPVTIACILFPAAQAFYFWGRILTGSVMPFGPVGALSRYITMGICIYILYAAIV